MRNREEDAFTGSDYPNDATIQLRVRDALSWESRLRGTVVKVRVVTSRVILEGQVHTDEQKRIAGNVANGVWGVGEVINNLKVSG